LTLGADVPVFDIASEYKSGDQQDLLVRNAQYGTALAAKFKDSLDSTQTVPQHTVVLMRRHGYTTHGRDIETAVYRAIYTKTNAAIQTNAMSIRSAFAQSGLKGKAAEKFEFEPLTAEMCEGCTKMNEGTQDKPWRLWVAEVEKSALYINRG
jgi:ribulose-5-phosphate 4-epimerase/fuculose-1-phosphate aldolase